MRVLSSITLLIECFFFRFWNVTIREADGVKMCLSCLVFESVPVLVSIIYQQPILQ